MARPRNEISQTQLIDPRVTVEDALNVVRQQMEQMRTLITRFEFVESALLQNIDQTSAFCVDISNKMSFYTSFKLTLQL